MKLEKEKKDVNKLELQKRLNQYNLKKYGEGKFTKTKDGDFGNSRFNEPILTLTQHLKYNTWHS